MTLAKVKKVTVVVDYEDGTKHEFIREKPEDLAYSLEFQTASGTKPDTYRVDVEHTGRERFQMRFEGVNEKVQERFVKWAGEMLSFQVDRW